MHVLHFFIGDMLSSHLCIKVEIFYI
jgi:hypothetical protein